MLIWGITALTHDASIAVVCDGEILFAGEAERYSGIKHDRYLNEAIVSESLKYGVPDKIAFYENVWSKKLRQLWHGNFSYALDFNKFPKFYLKKFSIDRPVENVSHHLSHAVAGYYTSEFEHGVIVVIDSLGEWQTVTIWRGDGLNVDLIYELNFPTSIGIFYSAFTKRCGLKPNEEEYITMGMAAYGDPLYVEQIINDFVTFGEHLVIKDCSLGVKNYLPDAKVEDIAASIQKVVELCIMSIMTKAKELTQEDNLVYMGGVALNCVINSSLSSLFKNVWVMPNPGDAGSSLGCAAWIGKQRLKWRGPYLGTLIEHQYDIDHACDLLASSHVIGVASGRAEFGPRALGNRSLLADPRYDFMKDKVNEIKKRQKFRPFAPAILEEHASSYFENCCNSPYMQYIFKCRFPDDFPAICHVDGTSRVQTVSEKDNPQFYNLLQNYYSLTGCPMLLNTSLNIRGKPIVNNRLDADEFESIYGVEVL